MTVQGVAEKRGTRLSSLSHLYCSIGSRNDLGFTSLFFENFQKDFWSQKLKVYTKVFTQDLTSREQEIPHL